MTDEDWDYGVYKVLKKKGKVRVVIGIVVAIGAMITAIFEPGIIYYWIFLWLLSYSIAGIGFYVFVKGLLLLRQANKMVPPLKFGDNNSN